MINTTTGDAVSCCIYESTRGQKREHIDSSGATWMIMEEILYFPVLLNADALFKNPRKAMLQCARGSAVATKNFFRDEPTGTAILGCSTSQKQVARTGGPRVFKASSLQKFSKLCFSACSDLMNIPAPVGLPGLLGWGHSFWGPETWAKEDGGIPSTKENAKDVRDKMLHVSSVPNLRFQALPKKMVHNKQLFKFCFEMF